MSPLSIYDFALSKEKSGEELYRALSGKMQTPALKLFFNWLADQELKHYGIIEKLKEKQTDVFLDFKGDIYFSDRFKKIIEGVESPENLTNEIDLLKEAFLQEVQSYRFYIEKSKETGNSVATQLFLQIAKEEQAHEKMLIKLIRHFKKEYHALEELTPEDVEE